MRNIDDKSPQPSWLERVRHKLDEWEIDDMDGRLLHPPRQVRTYQQALARRSQFALIQKVRDGQWLASAPYGYLRVPRTDSDGRVDGKRGYRLILDERTASTVPVIFTWYVDQRVPISAISARLAADPDRYPPPLDLRTDWPRHWTIYSVRTILTNPAYLGYVVWGRRRHGRLQPPKRWIWSDKPSHPPLVNPDLFWSAHNIAGRPPWFTAVLAVPN